MNTQPRGFIALISVLMLSVILLAAVISLAQYGIISRYALLTLEQKESTYALAEACVQVARIAVVNDDQFETTNRMVPIETERCFIKGVFPDAGFSRVEVSASSSGATTNLRVEIDTDTGDIINIEEY